MAMKEIQLELKVNTLKVMRRAYKEIFKENFDWKGKYYFDVFVGSFRFKSEPFTLSETSYDGEELIFNPQMVLQATLYQGKFLEVWFKNFTTEQLLGYGRLEARDFKVGNPKNQVDLDLIFNKMKVASIHSKLEMAEMNLEFESEEEEDLEDILKFGKKQEMDEDDNEDDGKIDEVVIVKREPVIRVTNKYKESKPLI